MSFVENNSKFRGPLFVDLAVGEAYCNLRCQYCMPSGHVTNSIDLAVGKCKDPLERVEEILDSFIRGGVPLLKISGGEFTLHREKARRILEYAVTKFDYVQLLSNGTIWDVNDWKWWVGFRNSLVQLSLDGHTVESNAARRLTDKQLSHITQQLDWLNADGVRFEINTVVSSFNASGLHDFLDYVCNRWPNARIYLIPIRDYQNFSVTFSDMEKFFLGYLEEGLWRKVIPCEAYVRMLHDYYRSKEKPMGLDSCYVPMFSRGVVDSGSIALCSCVGVRQVGNVLNGDSMEDCKKVTRRECPHVGSCVNPYSILSLIMHGYVPEEQISDMPFYAALNSISKTV